MDIEVILFDIGGVLVKFAGIKRLIDLMGNKISPDVLTRNWTNSKYVKLYECGQCNTSTFANGIIKEMNMNIAPDDFINEFTYFTKDFYPGAIEVLHGLKLKYTLACLSNTNTVQWNSLCERISIDKYFHHIFLSFEMGILKPERDAYTYVIKELGCKPAQIAFFDDNEANVQGGRCAGMNAYKVHDFNDLKNLLKSLKIN